MTPPLPHDYDQQRAAALAQFRAWAEDPRAAVLDTETTGKQGQVWEIGLTLVSTEKVLLHLMGNVPRGTIWEPGALRMHGEALRDQLQGYAAFRDSESEIRRVLSEYRLLAYNAEFDVAALRRSLTWQCPDMECVMLAYAVVAGAWNAKYRNWKWVSLKDAAAREGIKLPPQLHTPTSDARLTCQLIKHVAERSA